jgi:hypothetical protein
MARLPAGEDDASLGRIVGHEGGGDRRRRASGVQLAPARSVPAPGVAEDGLAGAAEVQPSIEEKGSGRRVVSHGASVARRRAGGQRRSRGCGPGRRGRGAGHQADQRRDGGDARCQGDRRHQRSPPRLHSVHARRTRDGASRAGSRSALGKRGGHGASPRPSRWSRSASSRRPSSRCACRSMPAPGSPRAA